MFDLKNFQNQFRKRNKKQSQGNAEEHDTHWFRYGASRGSGREKIILSELENKNNLLHPYTEIRKLIFSDKIIYKSIIIIAILACYLRSCSRLYHV